MNISCADYREAQQLLSLKKRLAEEEVDPKERQELEEQIRKLEAKMGL